MIPYFDTKHKRKSATLTTVIAILILFLIFNFGLKYLDPPEEFGIAVNFGTTDFGSGNVQPKEALKPAIQEAEADPVEEQEVIEEEEVIPQESETSQPIEETSEEVITQNNEENIAIKKREEARRKEEAEKKEKEKREEELRKKKAAEKKLAEEKAAEERRKVEAEQRRIAKKKQEEAEKRKKLDALVGGIGKDNGKADGGEGNDSQPGDKGSKTGDPNASGYYGDGGGIGSGGNYRLGNRKAVSMPKPTYDCNEQGKVFVNISVDQSGRVIAAQPGVKGTTNSAACLLSRAKEAALKTKFNSDDNAPSKQVGVIIYNFSLN